MKIIIEGVKRAKSRSILSALVALIAVIAICISMNVPVGMLKGDMRNLPANNDFSESRQTEETTDKDTDESSNKTSAQVQQLSLQNEDADNQVPDMKNGKMRSNPNLSYIALVSICAAGVVLLVIINVLSTKKRRYEFEQMQNRNIPCKAIKKQLFIEAFAVVLAAGIIGSGIGAAISQPVSKAIMSNVSFQSRQSDENADLNENMPENFDMENPPEKTDSEKATADASSDKNQGNEDAAEDNQTQDSDSGSNVRLPDESKSFNKGNRDNQSSGILMILCVSIISVLLMAIAAGVSCALPVKQVAAIEIKKAEIKNGQE